MDAIPKEIARLHYDEFCAAVNEHADDREALVEIKSALEVEKSFCQDKPGVRVWYVRKTIYVDNLLTKLKPAKKNPQQQTNGQTALVVTLAWTDEEGEELEDQFATMSNLSDFMAKTWSPDFIPRVRAYWQCHHLQAIPEGIWDETKPEWLSVKCSDSTESDLHETFSR
jgi:hypothetical protein